MSSWLSDSGYILAIIAASALAYIIFKNYYAYKEYIAQPLQPVTNDDRKLIRNEQVKLSASWANTIAAGILAAGLVPLVVAAIRAIDGATEVTWPSVVVALALTPMALFLHLTARVMLRSLRS